MLFINTVLQLQALSPHVFMQKKTALNQSSIKNNNFEAGHSCLPSRLSSESFPAR